MSGPGLVAVIVMIGIIMLVMSFWRQIAAFILLVCVAVFCFGIYYIVSLVEHVVIHQSR
jgi:hypothetical protein